jgi:hypothetical protein
MEIFSVVITDPHRSKQLQQTQSWIEKWVCSVTPKQQVVNNRHDYGRIVTQAMYDRHGRPAHVCPFVADSVDRDLYWLEESALTSKADIKTLLRNQILDFVAAPPAFDPTAAKRPAGLPQLWKTFMTIFPQVKHPSSSGAMPLFDSIHSELKTEFMQRGLMLGQFYPGCPQQGVYGPAFRPLGICPWPAYAIRYMAVHDHLFYDPKIKEHDAAYRSLFP